MAKDKITHHCLAKLTCNGVYEVKVERFNNKYIFQLIHNSALIINEDMANRSEALKAARAMDKALEVLSEQFYLKRRKEKKI